MLAARPEAQLALTNGGGLRADIPAGELTYGRLYEAMPFDNRFAVVEVKGKHVRRLVTTNIQRSSGFYSWGGLVAKARCKDGELDRRHQGRRQAARRRRVVQDRDERLPRVGRRHEHLRPAEAAARAPITMTDVIIRDAIADVLRKKKGKVEPAALYSATKRRQDYEGERPVLCSGKTAEDERGARLMTWTPR